MKGFIAVHVGAGYHAKRLRPEYKKICLSACKAAVHCLNNGDLAVAAAAAAVTELENALITNAGTGSNLTMKGEVECDAGIMDGESLSFGSVGAVSKIKNPIQVAQKILEAQNTGLLSGGRVPPSTVVGNGAAEWAVENGFCKISNRDLTTKESRGIYLKNMSLLNVKNGYDLNSSEQRTLNESHLLDTVGAVCVDSLGNVASAVSSGGILLKHSGRIGQAAVYGCGCWAQNSESVEKPSVACSVTGVGEYLVKTLFAYKCCTELQENSDSVFALRDVFDKHFLKSAFLKNVQTKLAGALAVKYYPEDGACEVSYIHNTKSMILGYMNAENAKMSCIVSVLPDCAEEGLIVSGSERRIKL